MTLYDEAEISEIWRQTPEYEAFLRRLRERGFSKFDSIKALRLICGVPLSDAKRIATFSEVWQDVREDLATMHEDIHDAILAPGNDAE